MIVRFVLAALLVCAERGTIHAGDLHDGDDRPEVGSRWRARRDPSAPSSESALHDAQARAAAGDPTALDALEALGNARPISQVTDDAWRSAAQLAERRADYARARRALEQVLATTTDERVAQRARADLQRLSMLAGAGGEWDATATEHDRLLQRIRAPGDPTPALRELEALVRSHPRYPRAAMAMLALAQGWEQTGETDRALRWLHEAAMSAGSLVDRTRAIAELARAQIRHADFDAARMSIARVSDPMLATRLRDSLATAQLRRVIRWIVTAMLALLAGLVAVTLRRREGSWRAALRAVARPPTEVLFLAPVGVVFAVVAETGNPIVARAVWAIVGAGTLVAWLSGALLDGRRGHLRARMLVAHAVLAAIAVLAAVYLVVDRDHMIDLIVETWRGGPAMR